MGTLASELGPFTDGFTQAPRIYVDANLPAGLVRFMRERLRWDVLFVIEENSLRRAPDIEHFRLAKQLRRTLVTLDQDFLDDDRFPPVVCGGIIVLSAPNEEQFQRLLRQVDRVFFPKPSDADPRTRAGGHPLPLAGRKLHVHTDWTGDLGP
jgi:predicted nuclease of predicted toxin-antitoxin system